MAVLYQIEFPNGKSYIGVTKQRLGARFSEHKSRSVGKGMAISYAFRKYGAKNAAIKPLVVANYDYLLELEKRAIIAYKTKSPSGYNLSDGGEGNNGYKHSQESKIKFRNYRLGTKLSEETKAKMRGRKHTQEEIEKMRLSALGKKHSPERIEKMRKSLTGYRHTQATKDKISAIRSAPEYKEKLQFAQRQSVIARKQNKAAE